MADIEHQALNARQRCRSAIAPRQRAHEDRHGFPVPLNRHRAAWSAAVLWRTSPNWNEHLVTLCTPTMQEGALLPRVRHTRPRHRAGIRTPGHDRA